MFVGLKNGVATIMKDEVWGHLIKGRDILVNKGAAIHLYFKIDGIQDIENSEDCVNN